MDGASDHIYTFSIPTSKTNLLTVGPTCLLGHRYGESAVSLGPLIFQHAALKTEQLYLDGIDIYD